LRLHPLGAPGAFGIGRHAAALERIARRQRSDALVVNMPARFPLTTRSDCGFAAPVDIAPGLRALRLAAPQVHCSFRVGNGPARAGRYRLTARLAAMAASDWSVRWGSTPARPLRATQPDVRDLPIGDFDSTGEAPVVVQGTGVLDLLTLRWDPIANPAENQDGPAYMH
jgi:hypothetical protein